MLRPESSGGAPGPGPSPHPELSSGFFTAGHLQAKEPFLDKKRPLLTALLIGGILAGYFYFVQKFPPARPPAPAPQAVVQPAAERAPAVERPPAPPAVERPVVPAQDVVLASNGDGEPRLRTEVTNRGAGVTWVELPRYRSRDGKGDLMLIPATTGAPLTLGLSVERLRVGDAPVPENEQVPFDRENWKMEAPPGAPVALSDEGNGLGIQKVIAVEEGRYHLAVAVTLENVSPEARQFHYRLWGPVQLSSESLQGDGQDLNLLHGERGPGSEVQVSVISLSSIKQQDWGSPVADRVSFIGISNNYFASILAAADVDADRPFLDSGFAQLYPDRARMRAMARSEYGKDLELLDAAQRKKVEESAHKNVRVGLRSRAVNLAPGQKVTHRYILYLGPRDNDVLAAYGGLNLPAINNYNFLVRLFLVVLKGFHFLLAGSWGLAIVGLTILVRVLLFPLNYKQQASMKDYQEKLNKIKPQMDEIKERYSGNRLEMNRRLQELFRENKINPARMMLGCLMIFLQLPIWYALYNSIQYSLDLRQSPFLWIRDLTQPDRLYTFGFSIPFLGNDLNLLPFIYVALTILQQKLQPKPTDPQMQQQMKMMTFMMVFFGFIFYNFPAGFLLYFITSAAYGIVETKFVKKALAEGGLKGLVARLRSGRAGGEEGGPAGALPAGGPSPERPYPSQDPRRARKDLPPRK